MSERFSHLNIKLVTMKGLKNWWKCLRLAIDDTFWEYAERTKVNGIWLLRPHRTNGISRWCWSLVLISLFLCGVFLSLKLWLKFYSYPILNTISNDLPITDVAFPGITICSPKVVNKERVQRYVQTLHIPSKYSRQEVATGFNYINAFTVQDWIMPVNDTSYEITDEILRLNNVSISEADMHVSASCEDFVKRCFWGNSEFSCRQDDEFIKFIPTISYVGPCCSFNSSPRNLSYQPFSANIFGIDGGLIFVGVEGSERNLSTGLIVLVHHPMDYVTEAAASVTITSNSESFVEISPIVQSSSPEVLELSQRKRDCLTSDDLELRSYRQSACMLACQSELIFKTCQCHPYHLPNINSDINECKLNDTLCYSQNYVSFKNVVCGHCLPNCYDITYSTVSYKTGLHFHNYSISPLYSWRNYIKDSFMIRIYLAKQVVPSIHKVTVMSWIGLLSDLGGVFNLCLGLSIVSVVEFFYYCTYRLRVNYQMHRVLMQ